MSEQDSTAPPASQEQLITHPSDCRCQWCRGKTPSQEQAQQPSVCAACVMPEQCAVDIAERGPCSGGVQQPSGGEVVDFEAACIGYARLDGDEYKLASMRRSPLMADGQLHPIYAFPDELVERHHQQLQSFATPKPEPMTDAEIEAVAQTVRPIVETGQPSWEHAVIRAYERARGITKEQA